MDRDGVDLRRVVFTDHALGQFTRRFAAIGNDKPKSFKKTALKLLANAKEDRSNPAALVRRIIEHNFKAARYFISSGWRFVIEEKEDKLVVITIEHTSFIRSSSSILDTQHR